LSIQYTATVTLSQLCGLPKSVVPQVFASLTYSVSLFAPFLYLCA